MKKQKTEFYLNKYPLLKVAILFATCLFSFVFGVFLNKGIQYWTQNLPEKNNYVGQFPKSVKKSQISEFKTKTKTTEKVAKAKPLKNIPQKKSTTYQPPKKIQWNKLLKGSYTIQVASYPDRKLASIHTRRLKEKGYNAFYTQTTINNRIWYRVNVGHFNGLKPARSLKKELLSLSIESHAFIKKIK